MGDQAARGALHPLSAVLEQVPGITRAKVQYYVQSRFVEPVKLRQGQVEHNWFTGSQIEFIRLIWGYERGSDLTPRKAHRRARADVDRGVVPLPLEPSERGTSRAGGPPLDTSAER